MTEQQKEFERKDIVAPVQGVPELSDESGRGTTVLSTAVERFEGRNPTVPAVSTDSPNAVIMMALQNNYTPELIEKMMDLAERNEKNIAKKDHFKAVANFKAKALPVKKDKFNNFLKCWYTSLGQLLQTYNPVLAEEGLSVSFQPPAQTESTMTVECRLAHSSGHVESVSMTGPIDTAAIGKQSGKASRNPMQDLRSTFTYLRSTTLEAILGVSGTEATQDDDGNKAGGEPEFISTDQATEINDLITETSSNLKVFLKVAKANSVSEILQSAYPMLIKKLNKKKADMRQPGE